MSLRYVYLTLLGNGMIIHMCVHSVWWRHNYMSDGHHMSLCYTPYDCLQNNLLPTTWLQYFLQVPGYWQWIGVHYNIPLLETALQPRKGEGVEFLTLTLATYMYTIKSLQNIVKHRPVMYFPCSVVCGCSVYCKIKQTVYKYMESPSFTGVL